MALVVWSDTMELVNRSCKTGKDGNIQGEAERRQKLVVKVKEEKAVNTMRQFSKL